MLADPTIVKSLTMPKANPETYPPIFRPTQEPDPEDGLNPMHNSKSRVDPVPLIDMECLDLRELDKACREWGIFRLVNHGVPTALLGEIEERAKNIFNMSFESKQGLTGCVRYFWGTPALSPAGLVLPRPIAAQNMDWVEGFNVPLSQLPSSFDNLHPFLLHFSNLLKDYGEHLTRLASPLFEAMMRNLNIVKEQPNSTYFDESTGLVRIYRYPRYDHNKGEAEHVVGMHVHTDSSLLSILSENQVGGLQFLKDDQWFEVNPIPNTLVVNLGDMMQALSDDEYKSVKHKVKLNKHEERVSICYFVFPEDNTLIRTSKYKPFSYSDFRAQVQRDVQTFGWKIGLQNFIADL